MKRHIFAVLSVFFCTTCQPVYAGQIYTFSNVSSATAPTTANVLIQKMTQGLARDTNLQMQQSFVWDSTDNLIVNGHMVRYADGTPVSAGYAAVGPILVLPLGKDLVVQKGPETAFWTIFSNTPFLILGR